MTDSSFADRIYFVVQLAKRLHSYGTTAQRLEGAICAVSSRLQLICNPWSNPTGLVLSFTDARVAAGGQTVVTAQGDEATILPQATQALESTQVIRMEPGDIDLRKLCEADLIAEQVLRGEIGLQAGSQALRALDRVPGQRGVALRVLCCGLTSASVAALFRTGWEGILTATLVGLIIGVLSALGASRPRLSEAVDAMSALFATLVVFAVAHYWTPLPLQSVVVASLIVLLPGLALTNAVSELSSQHLISGTARFAGALATLLKLTFGTVAATQIAQLIGWTTQDPGVISQPAWFDWVALAVGTYSFAVLFRADRRDYPLVMASALLGYLVTRHVGAQLGSETGVFVAGLVVGACANLYARLRHRPGALVRLPGIILLVPGSIGFRSFNFALERDVLLSIDTGFALLALLISLVAGLMFGNLLVPARHNL